MNCGVVIVGGGPSGIGAAVASAQCGLPTVLLERHDVLGGMGTSALVNNFCPAHLDGQRLIIGGVFAELRERLIRRKAIYASLNGQYRMEPYNPEVFAEEAADLCKQAGVEVRLNACWDAVEFPASDRVVFKMADGGEVVGRVAVDTTGDGVVAASAGVPFRFGRSADNAVMPLTYCYEIGPIDLDRLDRELGGVTMDPTTGEKYCWVGETPQVNAWVAEARAKGTLSIPRDSISCILSIPGRPTHATVNFGRVWCADPTNPELLAKAEKEGLRQVDEGVRFFREYLPGFEDISLIRVARQIGVRESRQIEGLYTLTGDDATSCRQFEDAIAQCCYAIDIHEPDSDRTTLKAFAPGTHFDIPWRSLIPASGPPNLVIGGRCISATQEAMSSFRVSPSAMAIGEAAGVTAALAARNGAGVRAVDPAALRQRLLETGAVLS